MYIYIYIYYHLFLFFSATAFNCYIVPYSRVFSSLRSIMLEIVDIEKKDDESRMNGEKNFLAHRRDSCFKSVSYSVAILRESRLTRHP